MAALSSAAFAVAAPPPRNISPRCASLSSSSSRFFSRGSDFRARIRLPVDRRRKVGFSCNCLFGLGVPELVVIAGVAALVFGPKNLPQVGKSIGKTVKSFQQAAKEFESELKKDGDPNLEPTTEKATSTAAESEKQETA